MSAMEVSDSATLSEDSSQKEGEQKTQETKKMVEFSDFCFLFTSMQSFCISIIQVKLFGACKRLYLCIECFQSREGASFCIRIAIWIFKSLFGMKGRKKKMILSEKPEHDLSHFLA